MNQDPILSLADFQKRNANYVFKEGSKQILLIGVEEKIFAIDNRCPHEGYPLSKGQPNSNCILTCNWHNWKFDLHTGECLIGGDNVQTYPVSINNGLIYVDTTGPSKVELQEAILAGLKVGFEKRQYGRITREITRLIFNDIDPLIALKKAIFWSHDRFEFGMTHAYAAAADWLQLYFKCLEDPDHSMEKQIICLTEAIDHIALDSLRHPIYPFPDQQLPYTANQLKEAIETEDHPTTFGLLNGAIFQGITLPDMEETLVEIALRHYNDFGHSLIYVQKVLTLSALLDDRDIDRCLLKVLTRSLIYSTREDLLPDFQNYPPKLEELLKQGFGASSDPPKINAHRTTTILNWTILAAKHHSPEGIFRSLLLGNAENMTRFDTSFQSAYDQPVTQNVGWLDFTHALTFANAVHYFAKKYRSIWPMGLLQMACFYGRNHPFTKDIDYPDTIDNLENWKEDTIEGLFDHGLGEPIHSAHLLKTCTSVFEEAQFLPEEEQRILYHSLYRLVNSNIKRKHARRITRQAIALVGKDH